MAGHPPKAGEPAQEQPPLPLPLDGCLDLHPFSPREIPSVTEEYLRECRRAGILEVRLVHGKGIGVQREAVARVLDRLPWVLSRRTAPPEAGGWGATLARLAPPDREAAPPAGGDPPPDSRPSGLMDLVLRRRSVRRFAPGEVSRAQLASLVEAARWAPSACNGQPWRFMAVTDPGVRARLVSECLGGVVPNRWASSAPAFLVACAARRLFPHRLAEPLAGVSYHQLDLGMALQNVQLRAVELGLGTCCIGWFRARRLRRLLDLPGGWKPLCVLAVGHPAPGDEQRRERLRLEEVLRFDRGEEPLP
jgi:nitroreductase